MKINLTEILSIISWVLIIAGGGLFSLVDISKRKQKKGNVIDKDLTDSNTKLMIIGAILTFLGILIIAIMRLTVGSKISLG